jgi:hypothetical protein
VRSSSCAGASTSSADENGRHPADPSRPGGSSRRAGGVAARQRDGRPARGLREPAGAVARRHAPRSPAESSPKPGRPPSPRSSGVQAALRARSAASGY